MANGKNFAASAQGASASTQERAKVAHHLFYESLTKAQLVSLFNSSITRPLTRQGLFLCAYSIVSKWCENVIADRYASMYDLTRKLEVLTKTRFIYCRVKNFVYICIGKRTEQSTQNIFHEPHYSGVPGAVPFYGSVRLPKHKGASLLLCTHTK